MEDEFPEGISLSGQTQDNELDSSDMKPSTSDMSPVTLLNKSECMWRVVRNSGKYLYSQGDDTSRLTWEVNRCGNVYPYTVTYDRVGRNKERKDNGKEFFPTRLH